MVTETEVEVFEDLRDAETVNDVLEAVEPLNGEERTVEGEVIVNAAGHMAGQALISERL